MASANRSRWLKTPRAGRSEPNRRHPRRRLGRARVEIARRCSATARCGRPATWISDRFDTSAQLLEDAVEILRLVGLCH
jgi:hypothetical protein